MKSNSLSALAALATLSSPVIGYSLFPQPAASGSNIIPFAAPNHNWQHGLARSPPRQHHQGDFSAKSVITSICENNAPDEFQACYEKVFSELEMARLGYCGHARGLVEECIRHTDNVDDSEGCMNEIKELAVCEAYINEAYSYCLTYSYSGISHVVDCANLELGLPNPSSIASASHAQDRPLHLAEKRSPEPAPEDALTTSAADVATSSSTVNAVAVSSLDDYYYAGYSAYDYADGYSTGYDDNTPSTTSTSILAAATTSTDADTSAIATSTYISSSTIQVVPIPYSSSSPYTSAPLTSTAPAAYTSTPSVIDASPSQATTTTTPAMLSGIVMVTSVPYYTNGSIGYLTTTVIPLGPGPVVINTGSSSNGTVTAAATDAAATGTANGASTGNRVGASTTQTPLYANISISAFRPSAYPLGNNTSTPSAISTYSTATISSSSVAVPSSSPSTTTPSASASSSLPGVTLGGAGRNGTYTNGPTAIFTPPTYSSYPLLSSSSPVAALTSPSSSIPNYLPTTSDIQTSSPSSFTETGVTLRGAGRNGTYSNGPTAVFTGLSFTSYPSNTNSIPSYPSTNTYQTLSETGTAAVSSLQDGTIPTDAPISPANGGRLSGSGGVTYTTGVASGIPVGSANPTSTSEASGSAATGSAVTGSAASATYLTPGTAANGNGNGNGTGATSTTTSPLTATVQPIQPQTTPITSAATPIAMSVGNRVGTFTYGSSLCTRYTSVFSFGAM